MSISYRFLSIGDVIYIHQRQMQRFGGALGLRDRSLLESAVQAVSATFEGSYLHKDVFEMGAAYAYGIIKNHPFVDGNKRAGMASALLFLKLNNSYVKCSSQEIYNIGISIATSQISLEEVASCFRKAASN